MFFKSIYFFFMDIDSNVETNVCLVFFFKSNNTYHKILGTPSPLYHKWDNWGFRRSNKYWVLHDRMIIPEKQKKQNIWINRSNLLRESCMAVKKYWKISRVVMVITSENIEFTTSGWRPRVVNSIFYEWYHNHKWYFPILFDSHAGFTIQN